MVPIATIRPKLATMPAMPIAAPPGARASRFAASRSMGQRTPTTDRSSHAATGRNARAASRGCSTITPVSRQPMAR